MISLQTIKELLENLKRETTFYPENENDKGYLSGLNYAISLINRIMERAGE